MDLLQKLTLSRWITRIGDHAWDLALPLALIEVFPGTLRPIAIYYLLTRLAVMIAIPSLGAWSDHQDRLKTVSIGITLQALGVTGVALLLGIAHLPPEAMIAVIVTSGALSQIGSSLMSVSIPADWIPTLLKGDDLARFNSRLKRVDLISEVASPLGAGALMTIGTLSHFFSSGFFIIASLNILSFLPEYLLLRSIYINSEALQRARHKEKIFEQQAPNFIKNIVTNGKTVLRHYLAPVLIAYSLLWLTVLTPHGILLTAFLKEEWHLSDTIIGAFRSLGALSGIVPTFIYAWMTKRFGIEGTALRFIWIQALTLLGASIFIQSPILFLTLIVLSRVGLYGFSLSEIHLRQSYVEPKMRGAIGGFATSMNYLMTLILYLIALWVADPSQFPILCYLSSFAILCGAISVGWFVYAEQKPL